jgi:ribosomal protein S1
MALRWFMILLFALAKVSTYAIGSIAAHSVPEATVNGMDNNSWEQTKSKYKLGQFVQGKAEFHWPFCVFVEMGESLVKGLIKIPDFLDEEKMCEEMYPEFGIMIGAIVVECNESNCREIYLNAKLSVLHKALVPLKIPTMAV